MESSSVEMPNPTRRVVIVVGAIVVAQVVLVLLFAWAASRQQPRDLPLAVAGPQPVVAGIVTGMNRNAPGAFDITVVDGPEAARESVTTREAYGALVVADTGTTLYTAPAASAAVASALSETVPAAVRQMNPSAQVAVTPLVPNPQHDPHGQGLPISLIALTITSIAAGALISLLSGGRAIRVAALLGYAVAAGALSTWALQGALEVLTGTWIANAGVMTLLCAAISAATSGLITLIGLPGIPVAAVVVFFYGFPLSGATSAWQLLPTPWGQIAQYLPVGAGNTALRSVAFFDGHGGGAALAVLAVWAVVGLVVAASARTRVDTTPMSGAAMPAGTGGRPGMA
ncbi:hypothetical protein GIY30_10225 [Gordonia sp. HNM0687]|uniref:DUF3533 domain-containing protein n=1 Tax=Gordonia mangrovi TaxID=2665643 RepID=A0A6L7GQ64_9ACTN|nr:hypothetical protein [Gordonia mangrovi]MXP21723.1 hypothetical protein [Gordonia mangrovi]UVF80454.1 ABC transporter permease [Gordonia mangrovi]